MKRYKSLCDSYDHYQVKFDREQTDLQKAAGRIAKQSAKKQHNAEASQAVEAQNETIQIEVVEQISHTDTDPPVAQPLEEAEPKLEMPPQEWKAYLQAPNIVVKANQADIERAIRSGNSVPTIEQFILVNAGLKRTVKSLRKKLARARVSFNRVMAETREAPDWYVESEIGSLSDDMVIRPPPKVIEEPDT